MKKVYFISDFHLGIDTDVNSKVREKFIVNFLESIKHQAEAIYLLGDILDYWFEYAEVVPKGFVRLFGKIAELTDMGIHIEWHTGNHDMWTFGYLEKELGVKIKKLPSVEIINGKNCFLCHGDGLGKGDHRFKIIKAILSNRVCQFLFSLIPSRTGIWLMKNSSKRSRYSQNEISQKDRNRDKHLHEYFEEVQDTQQIDYFVYGHLHHGEIKQLKNKSSLSINLGDWTTMYTYAVMDDKGNLKLKKYATLS